MRQICFFALLFLVLLVSCSKSSPIDGTSWESTDSHFCYWENMHLNDDYTEVLSFGEDRVVSKTLKNGYTYRNNGSFKYEYVKKSGGTDIICIYNYYDKDTAADFFYYGDRIVYGVSTIFYKQ